ncbi:hypothetical protein [Klebsiella pneumoniae]|uniref:hypothetical protein n=1 Tax=Klebsiella pneumoniae TaxID=573 RepID=UPI00296F67A5|nr:hypothetical protein [Klebsiella pneumoniae]
MALDTRQFEPLKGDTEVGRYIAKLGGDSDRAVLARLGTVGDDELRRLEFLKRTLLESDPVPQALALERLATRLDQAQRRAEEVQRWVNDRAIARAKELITTEKTAHLAMQLAQARLQDRDTLNAMELPVTSSPTATLLEGTGAELWQTMYRAAEAFSQQTAYPEHPFRTRNRTLTAYSASNLIQRMPRSACGVSRHLSPTAPRRMRKPPRLRA